MVTRRGIIKGAIVGGAAALAAGSIVAGLKVLMPVPPPAEEGFVYTIPTSSQNPMWYGSRAGRVALESDFAEQQGNGFGFGASALWRAKLDDLGTPIPNTGFPALIMRLDPDRMITPPDLRETVVKDGFAAVFDVDTFLCCNPGLNFARTRMFAPPPSSDVLIQNPASVVAPDVGVIFDPCHWSQYDPFRRVWDAHPKGQRYLAAHRVAGPGPRERGGLPIIPIDVLGGKLVGLNSHPEWYRGYCGL